MPVKQSRNSKDQRRENAFTVIDVIRNSENGLTRKQITEITGLSFPSVNDIVNYLDSFNLLEIFKGKGQSNKMVPCYRFTGGNNVVLGMSILPGTICCTCCDLKGQEISHFNLEYEVIRPDSFDIVIEKFLSIITDLKHKEMNILGLGIGAPGLLDIQKGCIQYAAQFHELESLDLKGLFHEKLNIPVFLEHNSNLSAFAEKRIGVARNFSDFIYVILNSGIGGSLFHGNRLFRGSSSFLGELGHSSIDPEGKPCQCGNRGCLELYAGRNVIAEKIALCKDDEEKDRILSETAVLIASSISNLVSFLGVSNIVYSGKTIQDYPELFFKIRQFLLIRTLPVYKPEFNILKSSLGDYSSAMGAALWMGEIALSNLSSTFFGPDAPDMALKLDGVMKSSL
jgi:N-acetylglucosamine repressor